MENRAAVFTSNPQAVEVYQSGAWWPGDLLGWRHDISGSCQVWVRVALGGAEESAWMDLAALRLPETQEAGGLEHSLAGAPSARKSSSRSGPAPLGSFDPSETASLPLIRDRSVAATRRSVGIPSSVGVQSASHQSPAGVRSSGGRRRAPEGAASTAPPAVDGSVRGRHRAPGDPGRHRAADTGLLPAVTDELATAQRPAVTAEGRSIRSARPARPAEPRTAESLTAVPRDSWSALDPEPELLTRPMRLSDLGSQSRRPRLDGFLASV
jgi:hypothetical protein